MAIEIKELVIRGVALHDEKRAGKHGEGEGAGGASSSAGHDEVVAAAVREVMRILKTRRDR